MLNSTVLTEEDIIEVVNLKGREKGIEVTHIEITNGIRFLGKVKSKLNSNFKGILYIKKFFNNKIVLEIEDFNITSFGILRGSSNIVLKAIVKMIGEDYITIRGNYITIDLEKINDDSIFYNIPINDVFIKDKSLYIIGTNLSMYLHA